HQFDNDPDFRSATVTATAVPPRHAPRRRNTDTPLPDERWKGCGSYRPPDRRRSVRPASTSPRQPNPLGSGSRRSVQTPIQQEGSNRRSRGSSCSIRVVKQPDVRTNVAHWRKMYAEKGGKNDG